MSGCAICEHAKVEAIDAALAENRWINVIVRQFRVNPVALKAHVGHRAAEGKGLAREVARQDLYVQGLSERWVVRNWLREFQEAWRQADVGVRQRMVVWLREQLREEEMVE